MEPDAPIIDFLAPETLLPIVGALYELPEPVICDWLSSGLNDVFHVTTGSYPYILKVYRAGWRTQAEVAEEIAALHHLARKGVAIVLPIARRDGAFAGTLTVADRERPMVLFAWAKGEEIKAPDAAVYRRFGQVLADVHSATDDFTDAPVRYDLESLLIQPLRELEPALEDRPNDRDFLRELVVRLRECIESLPPGTLDRGYCHGDFRPANLRVDEATDAVTVFDFELGGIGFRAYDLAYAQTNLHPMVLELLWGAPSLANSDACWTAFLDGYAERRPRHAADRAAIPLFVAMRPIQIMEMLVKNARQSDQREVWPPADIAGALFERALGFLRAWQAAYL
jgi:Ser/Thr protein kinase RdoA (MazF antagonist)